MAGQILVAGPDLPGAHFFTWGLTEKLARLFLNVPGWGMTAG